MPIKNLEELNIYYLNEYNLYGQDIYSDNHTVLYTELNKFIKATFQNEKFKEMSFDEYQQYLKDKEITTRLTIWCLIVFEGYTTDNYQSANINLIIKYSRLVMGSLGAFIIWASENYPSGKKVKIYLKDVVRIFIDSLKDDLKDEFPKGEQ